MKSPRPRTRVTPTCMPTATPSTPPITAMITDSHRIMARSWRRDIPTARARPSSRVRSTIDSASVLTMPSTAMSTARPSRMATTANTMSSALLNSAT